MENILMRFCRETNGYSTKAVAAKLNIPIKEYRDIERGDILLTGDRAKQLGKLYKVPPSFFLREAEQLDLLLTREAIIQNLKEEINLLSGNNRKKTVAAS